MFVQDYIYTLFCKDEDADVVREFVKRLVSVHVLSGIQFSCQVNCWASCC